MLKRRQYQDELLTPDGEYQGSDIKNCRARRYLLNWDAWKGKSFLGSNLTEVELEGINLEGGIFNSSTITGGSLKESRLVLASFISTTVENVKLYRTNFSKATIVGGKIYDVDVENAVFEKTFFSDVYIARWENLRIFQIRDSTLQINLQEHIVDEETRNIFLSALRMQRQENTVLSNDFADGEQIETASTYQQQSPPVHREIEVLPRQRIPGVTVVGESLMLDLNVLKRFGPDSLALFSSLASQGHFWEDLLQQHLYQATAASRAEGEAVIHYLIEQRDQVDEVLYLMAIKRLLGEENKLEHTQQYYYSVDWKDKGVNKHLTSPALRYLEIVVKKKKRERFGKQQEVLIINVVAPGSRDLTSDIDASIQVVYCSLSSDQVKNCLSTLPFPQESFDVNADAAMALQAAVVYYFNQLNLQYFGVTSAHSRDSNVYAKDFPDDFALLKFNNDDVELKGGSAIQQFLARPAKAFFQQNKKNKQQLELAASLFSLREYYGEDQDGWNRLFKYFYIHPPALLVPMEFSSYMKQIKAYVDQWFSEKQNKRVELLQGDTPAAKFFHQTYRVKAQLGSDGCDHLTAPQRAADSNIAIDNYQYVAQLLELAKIKGRMNQIDFDEVKATLSRVHKQLNELDAEIKVHEQKVIQYQDDPMAKSSLEKALEDKKSERADHYEQFFEPAKDNYIEAVKERAALKNALQEAQIKANLYANEAYINLSAVYHTVNWVQSQADDLAIDRRHIVMCSILQQVGLLQLA